MIIESSIKSVTVYKDRAQVERTGVKELAQGEHTLIFTGLPNNINTNSLQVTGGSNCILQDMKVKDVYLEEVSDDKRKEVLFEIEELEFLIDEINDRITNIKHEKTFLQSMVNVSSDNPKKSLFAFMVPDKMQEMLKFYNNKLNALDDQIRDNKKELKKLKQRLNRLQNEMNGYSQNSLKTEKQVELKIFVKENSNVEISVSYIVYNANWSPVYDLRLNSNKKILQLSYNAIVKQRTGENWENVELKLSTAQPQLAGTCPELSPWYVDIFTYQPPPPSQKIRAKVKAKKELMKMSGSTIAPEGLLDELKEDMFEEEPMEIEEAIVETGATSVVFAIPGSNTISDNYEEHKVGISSFELEAELEYNSVPKLSPFAYLTASCINETDFPLLSGKTNVFLDNSFVSNSKLNLVAPNEKFKTSLGIDEGIKIEHKLVNKLSKDEGIFSKKSKVIFEYKIEVTNNKPSESHIKIKDQIPIAQNQEIKIELIEPKIKENTDLLKKTDHGMVEWALTIPPSEKEILPVKFSVEYPRDETITGLL